jgi:hypothetical protein
LSNARELIWYFALLNFSLFVDFLVRIIREKGDLVAWEGEEQRAIGKGRGAKGNRQRAKGKRQCFSLPAGMDAIISRRAMTLLQRGIKIIFA